MHTLNNFKVNKDSTILEVLQVINNNQSRCALVMQEDKVLGVISEGDILRGLIKNMDIHASIRDLFQINLKFLDTHDYSKALKLFTEHGISLIPILDKNFRLLSLITLNEVLKKTQLRN